MPDKICAVHQKCAEMIDQIEGTWLNVKEKQAIVNEMREKGEEKQQHLLQTREAQDERSKFFFLFQVVSKVSVILRQTFFSSEKSYRRIQRINPNVYQGQ